MNVYILRFEWNSRQICPVDFKAGERHGVIDAAKPKTQQPAEPTAMRFSGKAELGVRVEPWESVLGVVG